MVPSLTLCSSIKIPSCARSKRNGNKSGPSTSHENSHGRQGKKNHAQGTKTTGDMVNLKVPSRIPTKERKNSFTNLICEQSEIHEETKIQKTTTTKRSKKLRFLTVPDIPSNPKNLDETLDITNCDSSVKSISYYGDVLEESEESYDWSFEKNILEDEKEEESENIPLIKPWTLEELNEMNKKCSVLEKRIKKLYEINKKSKRKVSKPSIRAPDDNKSKSPKPRLETTESKFNSSEFYFNCEWTNSESNFFPGKDLFHLYEQSVADSGKLNSEGEKYYKSKLAQLHMLERGVKS